MVWEDCKVLSLRARTKFTVIWGILELGLMGIPMPAGNSLHVLTDRCYHPSTVTGLLTQLYILRLRAYKGIKLFFDILHEAFEKPPLIAGRVGNVWQRHVTSN